MGHGRPHLVYVSIVGVDRVPLGYYRQKLAGEGLVAGSGLPWTTLRATQFHNLLDALFTSASRIGVLPVLAGAVFQPVDVHDVAARLVELAAAEPAGRVLQLGGPAVRPMDELARAWLRARGRPPPGARAAAARPPGPGRARRRADGPRPAPRDRHLRAVPRARAPERGPDVMSPWPPHTASP